LILFLELDKRAGDVKATEKRQDANQQLSAVVDGILRRGDNANKMKRPRLSNGK
jgi:hypothetical protein